ncbi:hypothetical protein L3X38_009902 [Prunus dulcis]|uniref:Uncharacterized protein n=1 Tax=Prunus dulcis TaxID=3755 RepID=A0AAD4WGQ0_PRUDU|nr:hypothetical protein L3X38_009902 [Prunus dulcis]
MCWPSNASTPSLSLVCSIGAELLSQYPLITEDKGAGSSEDSSFMPFGMWHRHGMKRCLLGGGLGSIREKILREVPFSRGSSATQELRYAVGALGAVVSFGADVVSLGVDAVRSCRRKLWSCCMEADVVILHALPAGSISTVMEDVVQHGLEKRHHN